MKSDNKIREERVAKAIGLEDFMIFKIKTFIRNVKLSIKFNLRKNELNRQNGKTTKRLVRHLTALINKKESFYIAEDLRRVRHAETVISNMIDMILKNDPHIMLGVNIRDFHIYRKTEDPRLGRRLDDKNIITDFD